MARIERDDLPAATIIAGRYRVHSLLGRGGMAAVYRATDEVLQREVALKVMRRSVSTEERVVQRFLKEARRMASLDSPQVVPVYDAGQDGQHVFLVMKLLGGNTLEDLMQSERSLPLDRVVNLVGQLLEGLGYLHARGLVHRDVKPSNLMVMDDDRAVLLDLGIARSTPTEGSSDDQPMPRHVTTEEQMLLGTPEYMAPERVLDQAVDGRSDLYAVGILLYEALTGRVPFEGKTPIEVCMRQLNEQPPPPRRHAPRLSEGFERVILRALAKKPEHRYQTSEEMRRALIEALLEARPAPGSDTASRDHDDALGPSDEDLHTLEAWSPDPKRRRRKGAMVALLAGTGVACLAFVVIPIFTAGRFTGSLEHPTDGAPASTGTSVASASTPGRDASAGLVVDPSSTGLTVVPTLTATVSGAANTGTALAASNPGTTAATAPETLGESAGPTGVPSTAARTGQGDHSASPVASNTQGGTSHPTGAATKSSTQVARGSSQSTTPRSGTGVSSPARTHSSAAASSSRSTRVPDEGTGSRPARAEATSPPATSGGDPASDARARLSVGDTSGALKVLEAAMGQSPENAELFRLKGDTYYRIGNKGAAIAAYRRYLSLSPSGADAAHVQRRLEELGGR